MKFNIRADLKGLKEILEMNTNQLRIYQFEKPLPETLVLKNLPKTSAAFKKTVLYFSFNTLI